MITFPGISLLVVYGLIGVPMMIVALIHLYHAFRYGTASPQSVMSSGIYVAGLIVILVLTFNLLQAVPFDGSFTFDLPLDRIFPSQ